MPAARMTATLPMPALARRESVSAYSAPTATVGSALRAVVARAKEIRSSPLWQKAFAGSRKDRRYYDIVEDTMHPEITHRYLMITDQHGHAGTIQPFFVTSIDMNSGAPTFGTPEQNPGSRPFAASGRGSCGRAC